MIDFPQVPPGEPVRVSAHTYVAYTQCPAQAGARLEGRFGPETTASFRGALAHRMFARHLIKGPVEAEAFEQAAREEIGTALNPKLGALGLKPSTLRPVIAEVAALYQRFSRVPSEGFVDAEVDLCTEPSPGVLLVGKVDAVFEEAAGRRLVEWKTGELGAPLEQLRFYAFLWALIHDQLPGRVEAVSVRTGERFEAAPTREELERVAAVTAELVAVLRRHWGEGEELARTGGPWCRYCPLLSECPEGQAVVELTGS